MHFNISSDNLMSHLFHIQFPLPQLKEVSDVSEDVISTLQAVQVFLHQCWPLVPAHSQTLLQMLLRLLCDVTYKEETTGKELDAEEQHIVQLTEDCLMLVVKIAPEQSKMLCLDIKNRARFNRTFEAVIDRVFE